MTKWKSSGHSDQPGHLPSLISLLCASFLAIWLRFHCANREDPDQNGQMPSLISICCVHMPLSYHEPWSGFKSWWNLKNRTIFTFNPISLQWDKTQGVNATMKPALSGHSERPKNGFQDRLSLNAGQKSCRMLQESILQDFWQALSYHLSLEFCFVYFWVTVLWM